MIAVPDRKCCQESQHIWIHSPLHKRNLVEAIEPLSFVLPLLVHGQSVHWSASPHSHLPCDRGAAFLVELGSCSCRKLHQDACQLDMLSTAMTYRMEEEHVLGRQAYGRSSVSFACILLKRSSESFAPLYVILVLWKLSRKKH